jgi:hypothetical protein
MQNDELVRLSNNRELLHFVSHHSVAGTIRSSDTPCDNLVVWSDILTVGPAGGKTLGETTQIRKRFFQKSPRPPKLNDENLIPPSYTQRNRVLRHYEEWDEVALWFGPSVMEQFSLLQILAAISTPGIRKTQFTSVTCPKLALGVYRPEDMSEFFRDRVVIHRKQIDLARKVWELYGASDPMQLFHFSRTRTKSYPILCNALLRQMEEYPSLHNGLSASEEGLLRGVQLRGTVVRAVGHFEDSNDDFRSGDDELFDSLLGLLTCEHPLIEPVKKGSKMESFADFRKLAVQLSAAGESVFHGLSDHITLNGINRWIGGVHLNGKAVPWRWDSEKELLKQY